MYHLARVCFISLLISCVIGLELDQSAVRCLAKVLVSRAEALHPEGFDSYTAQMKAFYLENEEPLTYEMIGDDRFVKEIELLFNFLESIDSQSVEELNACNINTKNTLKRCEKESSSGKCVQINNFTYRESCIDVNFQVVHHNAYCYRACPQGFHELGNRCKKPTLQTIVPRLSEPECKKYSPDSECEEHPSGMWLASCPENFERVLDFQCVPNCPAGWSEDRDFCYKQKKIDLGTPTVFKIADLLS
jgi:hypothetical protein